MRPKEYFFNILSNAVKYNHSGGNVSISTETFRVKYGKADVCYMIEDDGIGMSDEFQKRLFQPFEREGTIGTYSGTGMEDIQKAKEAGITE